MVTEFYWSVNAQTAGRIHPLIKQLDVGQAKSVRWHAWCWVPLQGLCPSTCAPTRGSFLRRHAWRGWPWPTGKNIIGFFVNRGFFTKWDADWNSHFVKNHDPILHKISEVSVLSPKILEINIWNMDQGLAQLILWRITTRFFTKWLVQNTLLVVKRSPFTNRNWCWSKWQLLFDLARFHHSLGIISPWTRLSTIPRLFQATKFSPDCFECQSVSNQVSLRSLSSEMKPKVLSLVCTPPQRHYIIDASFTASLTILIAWAMLTPCIQSLDAALYKSLWFRACLYLFASSAEGFSLTSFKRLGALNTKRPNHYEICFVNKISGCLMISTVNDA